MTVDQAPLSKNQPASQPASQPARQPACAQTYKRTQTFSAKSSGENQWRRSQGPAGRHCHKTAERLMRRKIYAFQTKQRFRCAVSHVLYIYIYIYIYIFIYLFTYLYVCVAVSGNPHTNGPAMSHNPRAALPPNCLF